MGSCSDTVISSRTHKTPPSCSPTPRALAFAVRLLWDSFKIATVTPAIVPSHKYTQSLKKGCPPFCPEQQHTFHPFSPLTCSQNPDLFKVVLCPRQRWSPPQTPLLLGVARWVLSSHEASAEVSRVAYTKSIVLVAY